MSIHAFGWVRLDCETCPTQIGLSFIMVNSRWAGVLCRPMGHPTARALQLDTVGVQMRYRRTQDDSSKAGEHATRGDSTGAVHGH